MPKSQVEMLGFVIYIIGCFFGAGFITFVYVMTRPVQTRDEMRSWRILLGMFIFVTAAPYLYAESMTAIFGKEMKQAVELALEDAEINGELLYYKVMTYKEGGSRVIAVAKEEEDWGGTARPVLALTLKKEDGEWFADSYRIVNSDMRNEDGFTFPPYY